MSSLFPWAKEATASRQTMAANSGAKVEAIRQQLQAQRLSATAGVVPQQQQQPTSGLTPPTPQPTSGLVAQLPVSTAGIQQYLPTATHGLQQTNPVAPPPLVSSLQPGTRTNEVLKQVRDAMHATAGLESIERAVAHQQQQQQFVAQTNGLSDPMSGSGPNSIYVPYPTNGLYSSSAAHRVQNIPAPMSNATAGLYQRYQGNPTAGLRQEVQRLGPSPSYTGSLNIPTTIIPPYMSATGGLAPVSEQYGSPYEPGRYLAANPTGGLTYEPGRYSTANPTSGLTYDRPINTNHSSISAPHTGTLVGCGCQTCINKAAREAAMATHS